MRPLLIRVHMLPRRRGANHIIVRCSSTGFTVESTHPWRSASSTDSS